VLVHAKDQIIEVTTYRAETTYSDKRHPDAVKFGVSLKEDLVRRDFTVNALAFDGTTLVDEFEGRRDISRRLIRAVGDPNERFGEDALRMMRAVRFSAELGFRIHPATWNAIINNLNGLDVISKERVRDELMKIVASDDPWKGFWFLYQTGLLDHVIPELTEGVGMSQPRHHIYSVFVHSLLSMAFCPSPDPIVKLAALLHDVGKPVSAQGDDENRTFYNHEVISAEMTRRIMRRLKFSKKDIDRAVLLVRQHMFYYNMGEITDAGVRRLLRRVGPENMKDLMDLRIGDRMGGGTQKEKPYKFVELEKRIIEVQKDPIDTRMLEIDGNRVMEMIKLKPGPKVGYVMQTLLNEILDDPNRNTVEYLEKRVNEMADEVVALSDKQAKEKEIILRERTQTYEN
jgi:poly(A) polymerase/tRNA nucleotidyltransferase (CCA-adding enzyme)